MMRPALLFILLSMTSFAAQASDTVTSMPMASPFEDNPHEGQLVPKRISLNDLQNIMLEQGQRSSKALSTIEALYSARIIEDLEQYGYNFFKDADKDSNQKLSIPAGAVQDKYILSAGDQLNIILRGQTNTQSNYTVNNQGLLVLENIAPITAAGRSLGDVKKDLQQAVSALHNTQIFTSLASIRQIGVLIVGHVQSPGRKNLTSFNTVLDALIKADGIQKTGSLRRIKLVRNGKSHYIDLYQLFMASSTGADKLLQDGDRLIIPPIGATMAISGNVKRPGIYELRQSEKISTHQAMGLAGGVIIPGQNRFIKLEYTPNGDELVQDITAQSKRIFGNGAILSVTQSEQKRSEAVTLSGATRQPGTHDLKKAKTLIELINNKKILGENIYPLIGVIERRDPEQLTKQLIPFSPAQILKKKQNQKLLENDVVRLFSDEQIRSLQSDSALLHKVSSKQSTIDDPILKSFLQERSVFVRGAVRQSGAYPITEGADLKNILAVAGGVTLESNKENIELASRENGRRTINIVHEDPSTISIKSGDTIRVNQKFHKITTKTVALLGEVNHPGNYDLMAGDTLLDLIQRAGGLTEQAYADGAIFSRANERKREETRYKAQAQDLEMKLANSLQQLDDDKKPDMTQVSATQSLISQLKDAKALGRITVEADPASLSANPEQNILLEKGDRIFIPKRPLTVRVAGEVLSPAALQFRTQKDAEAYLREAGGTSHYADKDRTFVIYPDGSAQPVETSSWSHSAVMIPPGSTIVVPRDPKPFDFLDSAGRVGQLLANLAISGLYIEAIGDDN